MELGLFNFDSFFVSNINRFNIIEIERIDSFGWKNFFHDPFSRVTRVNHPLLYCFWVEKLPSKEIQMRSVDSLEEKKRGRKKIAMVNRGRSPLHFSDVDIKN